MKSTRGFTLIEVMASLLILCTVSLAFSHVVFFVIKTREESEFLNRSSLLAQLFIEDQRDPSYTTSHLYTGEEWNRYTRTETYQSLGISSCERELILCRVMIEWCNGDKVFSYHLSSLLLAGD